MIEKQPYTGDYSLNKVYTSDWRVIRRRLLGEDYKQISWYGGCWSEPTDRVRYQRALNEYKRGFDKTDD